MRHARPLLATIATLACLAAPSPALAQGAPPSSSARPAPQVPQGAGRVDGIAIHAASGQPIGSATVTVHAEGETALLGGALTRPNGGFRIEGLRPGRYTVRVRSLGFAPVTRTAVVTAAAPTVDLGRIQLAPVAAQLSGVRVQAEREGVTLAPDRNSYAVKDMPATSGGTAVDVLRNVPSVEVDGDNKVSLRGQENVVVQINGRVTPMRGEALGSYLASLPANMVAKVEVVPNPSAKNDPEGLAGIINVVLKQNTDLGTSGGYTLGGGSTGQLNASGNLGHQQGAWTLFGNYAFMNDRRTVEGYSNRQNLFASPTTYLDADIDGTMYPRSHSLTQSTEYKPRERDVFASNLLVNYRTFERDNGSFYRDLDADRELTGRWNRLTDQSSRDLSLDYAMSYRLNLDPNKHFLNTEARYNRLQSRNDVFLTNEALVATSEQAGSVGLETNFTEEHTDNVFLQSDYTRTFGSGLKLETGYKGTFRWTNSDFDVATSTDGSGTYQPDVDRSNAFDFQEQLHAAYGVASQKVGKFDLQGGLRLEQANTRFDLATTGEQYDNDYRSAFPSALAAYNLDPKRQLKLSYSKRISRPDVRQLNPFGFREDALNVFEGNPRLQPEYTHSYELGYQQSLGRGSLQLTPFFRHTVDAVRFIGRVDDQGVSRVSFRNVATVDSYGADLSLSVRTGKLSLFGGGSMFEQQVDASNLDASFSNRAFAWSARANATYKVTPSLDAQAFVMYRAPQRIEQGTMSRFTMANVALKQKLRGDQSSVTLRVADPFGTMGWGIRASDGRVYQTTQRNFGARGVFLTYQHSFGKQPKIRQRPQEPEGGQAAPGMGPG